MLRYSVSGFYWVASRCLQAPPHPLDCHRCRDACPTEALFFQEDGGDSLLQASDACHGCTQCVAACPTEALVSTEVSQLTDAQPAGQPLRLGCHRARSEHSLKRLHCLRSLGPDQLAWLRVRAMPKEMELHLPEGCQGCLAAPVAESDMWLEHAKILCRVITAPADGDYQSPVYAVSRRALLMGSPPPSPPAIEAHDNAPRARRLQRHLTTTGELAELSPPALTEISLDPDACLGHGVCARVCPTQALEETERGELRFDPAACLDCGHCISACPSHALTNSSGVDSLPRILREGSYAKCFECGRRYAAMAHSLDSDSPRCPACRREDALMKESFHDLFG
ncbi:4Fe-4S dicluster domain-containing protein [Billgrantia sp. LNSP4103-1]